MAINPIGPLAGVVTLPSATPTIPAVARILARHDREKVEAFISVAIDLLDALDGDPDFEDTTDLEDDHTLSRNADQRPGCFVSDPEEEDDCDSAVDDYGCDDINDDREHDETCVPSYSIDQTKGPELPCPGAQRALMRPHLDRIRRTRCERRETRASNGAILHLEYRLRDGDV